jgi:PAS domain S-box-containing protein
VSNNIPNINSLLETIPGVIYRIDLTVKPDGQLVFLNAKMEELCGYAAEDFLSGRIKWFDIIVQEDLALIRATVLAKEENYRLEYRIKHKEGDVRWVLNQGRITYQNNKPLWSDGVILDVTASKLQSAELELRQKELSNLISALDDIIMIIDADGCIKNYFARDWRSLMLPPAAFLNKPIKTAFAALPHHAILFERAYQQTIAQKKNQEIEYSFQDGDTPRWYRARFVNLEDPGTVSVLIEDITVQKTAGLALEKSEQLLRWASAAAKIGGWELNLDTKTIWWADEIYRIRELEKTTDPTLADAFAYYEHEAKPIMEKALHEALHFGKPWNLEIPIVTAKGNKKWVRDIGIPEMKDGKCVSLRGVFNDITEKKNAELELLKREEQLELAILGADLATWDWDINTGNIKTNSRLPKMLGYSENETEPHISMAEKLIHPDDLKRVVEILINHLKGRNNFYQVEYRLQHRDGHWVWVLDKGRVVERNEKGKPVRVSGTRLDITERKLNELKLEAVNKELEQFKLAINTASIVTMADANGRIKFVNQKFLDITKYTREELIGQKHSIINSGYHSKKFWKEMWRTIGNGEIWRGEVRNRAKTGEFYWVDTFIVPIKDSHGKIAEFISIRNEITQRKRDEEKLQLLSMVASNTSNYVIITDEAGYIEWVNESFERASGYTLEEIKGLKPGSFLQGPDTDPEIVEYMSDRLAKGKAFSCELINYTKSGETYWVNINVQPLRDNHGKVIRFFAIMHNITHQKKLVTDLELATQKAVESDRLKSAFLANISHEIRTPMNAIMGFVELLERPNLPEAKRDLFFKLIQARSKDLLGIVNDILDISKIEAGQLSAIPVTGNLKELFDRLQVSFHAETTHLNNKPVSVEINLDLLPEQQVIQADFIKLNQVLTNLLTNAAKFTAQGSIQLSGKLTASQELLFTVRDTGMGIPPDQLEIIFKPFRQANDSIHLQFGGSGLGLAICKGLVEAWGGRIWVESELNNGSAFYFTMPFAPASVKIADDENSALTRYSITT